MGWPDGEGRCSFHPEILGPKEKPHDTAEEAFWYWRGRWSRRKIGRAVMIGVWRKGRFSSPTILGKVLPNGLTQRKMFDVSM
jgi:hypothetical protein